MPAEAVGKSKSVFVRTKSDLGLSKCVFVPAGRLLCFPSRCPHPFLIVFFDKFLALGQAKLEKLRFSIWPSARLIVTFDKFLAPGKAKLEKLRFSIWPCARLIVTL